MFINTEIHATGIKGKNNIEVVLTYSLLTSPLSIDSILMWISAWQQKKPIKGINQMGFIFLKSINFYKSSPLTSFWYKLTWFC